LLKRIKLPYYLRPYQVLVTLLPFLCGKTYHGRITKQGNKWLRWALAEASHKAIVKSPSLRSYYNKIKYKKGSNTATVALSCLTAGRQGNYLRLYIKFGRSKGHIMKKKFGFSGCPH